MAVVTDWTDPIGGADSLMSYTTIDAPDTTTAYTNAFPLPLPHKYITIYATATAQLGGNATFDLYGSYDGSTYVKLVDDIIATTDLNDDAAGTFDLEQYSAIDFKIAITTSANDAAKDVSFYLVYAREI